MTTNKGRLIRGTHVAAIRWERGTMGIATERWHSGGRCRDVRTAQMRLGAAGPCKWSTLVPSPPRSPAGNRCQWKWSTSHLHHLFCTFSDFRAEKSRLLGGPRMENNLRRTTRVLLCETDQVDEFRNAPATAAPGMAARTLACRRALFWCTLL